MKVETELEPRSKGRPHPKTPNGPLKRAFVVEEEESVRMLLQEVLEIADIEVIVPSGSIHAESYIQVEKFDVVLIGYCAPPEDAADLIRKIRKSGFNRMTPIIMISEDQCPGALSRGFEAGASFFVYKPLDKANLLSLIRVTQGAIEQEKRRFRRVPASIRVRLKFDHVEVLGETINISLNGALVRVPQTVPVGSRGQITLYLPEEPKPVVGMASVVRVADNIQMGILFDRFPVSESSRLQDYLLPQIS